eukprot:CAMPEP_0183828268 /NCGR_PEP_ID=MMETSP0807_2-20130328/2696_1 /TAXON_ID=88271 /ORGANISM="Picocystis salinarum, Strain CCMP1897" /LENGTH=691 /DNA_ID=CAMNT_0026073455 /DNA_START=527 /DNA_END=2602 /DNA_ORIENTATION=-
MARAGGWATSIPGMHVALVMIPLAAVLVIFRWRIHKRHRAASASAAAAAAWRAEAVKQGLVVPCRHAWYVEARSEAHAQLCCACHRSVPRAPALVHACSVCGIAVHAACLRNAPKDCRQRALPMSSQPSPGGKTELHRWCATGERAPEDQFQYQEEGACCLVCRRRVATEGTPAAAAAPSWTCSNCRAVVHVACLKLVDATLEKTVDQDWCFCKFGEHKKLIIPTCWVREHEKVPATQQIKQARSPWRRRRKLPADRQYEITTDGKDSVGEEPSTSDSDVGKAPLLCFVSMASGALQGSIVLRRLMRTLNPLQVVALPGEEGGPLPWLRLYSNVKGLQVLVAGGDGTVGWVMGCMDSLWPSAKKQPPIALLPLGTGNDLARCLGWGGNFDALQADAIDQMLRDIQRARAVLLDRWDISFAVSKRKGEDRRAKQDCRGVDGSSSVAERPRTRSLSRKLVESEPMEVVDRKVMNNYLGIGVDAKVTLDFHQMREAYPDYFQSQLGNKLWYTGVGAKDILDRACAAVPEVVQLEADGKLVKLPDDIEGVLILNIHNYMGGVQIWPDSEAEGWYPSSMRDGMLEIVGVYGSFHLGQLQVGLSTARRLVQCRRVKVSLKHELPVQIDGEPWLQTPCSIDIRLKGQAQMLRRVAKSRRSSAFEEILEDCERRGMISSSQYEALAAEFQRAMRNNPDP